VQVKYELLRRVALEHASVTAATAEYGVSRPTSSQAKAHFATAGIAGLVPRKHGPGGPHKLQGAALAFVEQRLVAGEPGRARALVKQLWQHFALTIHPRTIERAGAGKKTARGRVPRILPNPLSSSRTTKRSAAPPLGTRCRPRRALA
jgi:transposase